ncbi:MAG: hypothetical protein MZV63_53570 [Marinilabiliales bacterium]|nr:hypothetical protein [Marinilabiliales bacterium]
MDMQIRPRKVNADIFIDDKNVGGFPGWGEVLNMIDPWSEREEQAMQCNKDAAFQPVRQEITCHGR